MSNKVVLEEEEYVEALERIIERDFFPDLPTLRRQSERQDHSITTASVLRTSTLKTGDTTVQKQYSRQHHDTGRYVSPVSAVLSRRSAVSSWDHPTPTRAPLVDDHGVCSAGDQGATEVAQDPPAALAADMPLNRFVATHTSEDNAAFTELQEKALEDHKRKYHWAYDVDERKGDPKLHLLTNGEWISTRQRQIVDAVLVPKGPRDDRPSAPETWPFRARNALLFPPDLQVSNQICQVENASATAAALLENGNASSLAMVKHHNSCVGLPPLGKRETVYANSRFQTQRPAGSKETTANVGVTKNELELVQMTPVIAPGVDASPLMTWGDIEGTPMILDSRATPVDQAPGSGAGPWFHVKDTSKREKLANRLETEVRLRKSQSRQRTPTPLVSRGKRPNSELPTPNRVDSIRSRLSSLRSTPRTPLFGTDSELRASYATPLRSSRQPSSSTLRSKK